MGQKEFHHGGKTFPEYFSLLNGSKTIMIQKRHIFDVFSSTPSFVDNYKKNLRLTL
jgi:hypothetical protein